MSCRYLGEKCFKIKGMSREKPLGGARERRGNRSVLGGGGDTYSSILQGVVRTSDF